MNSLSFVFAVQLFHEDKGVYPWYEWSSSGISEVVSELLLSSFSEFLFFSKIYKTMKQIVRAKRITNDN